MQEKLVGLLNNGEDEPLNPKKFVLDCKHTVIKVLEDEKQILARENLAKDENLADNLMSS
jgi:hypothetical protein